MSPVTPSPDIPQLAADLKTRIWAWAQTNMRLASQFYDGGQWHFADENTNWYVGSPCFAALAATMYRYDNTLTKYRDIAIETLKLSLRDNLNPPVTTTPVYSYPVTPGYPGTIFQGLPAGVPKLMNPFDGGPWGTPDPTGSDENGTIEAGASFCWVIEQLYMSNAIDAPTAKAFVLQLKPAADWLIDKNGNPIWYTNGNYVAHECLFYAHLSRLCRLFSDDDGRVRYQQAYEQSMQTLIYPFGNNAPSNAQWAEYGYTVDVAGTGSSGTGTGPSHVGMLVANNTGDGSNETGHLTETSSHSTITPGVTNTFDGAYTQLQMDILATLLVINRDWRVNYLLNAIWNKLDALTNYTAYTIDCTGGSRQGGVRGWTGGYQNIIAMIGERTNNRTHNTNAICLGAWDNQVAASLTNQGQVAVGQVVSSQCRLWRINVATTLHCCYLVAPRL